MNNNITKIITQLNALGSDFKLSQYELASILDESLNVNVDRLQHLSYGGDDWYESWLDIQVPVSVFINDFKYMFRKDSAILLDDLVEYIYDLDFTSEIFKQTGVAHRNCDCPRCQEAEDLVYSDFDDEDFEQEMVEYLTDRITH